MEVVTTFFLLCSSLHQVDAVHKKYGKHDFPRLTPQGFEAANEFQMIIPKNIKDARKNNLVESTATYSFNKVSPTSIDNDDVVTVAFSTASPAFGDWVGAYSPPDVDVTDTTPIKYGWADELDDYLKTGEGSLTFNLTNVRNDVVFYYFSNSTSHAVIQAESELVQFKNPNQPLRPRIVATGDLDVLNLLWSSKSSKQPKLKWGTSSGKYTNEVTATTSTIERDEVCGSPASSYGWFDLGLIHTAELVGMKKLSDSDIFYIFGDEDTDDYSEEFVLHTPPLPGVQYNRDGSIRPTVAVLYDDLGRGSDDGTYTWNEYGRPAMYTMRAVGEEVRQGKIDVVYHGGDISYATGYIAVWDFFMDMISPVASGVVYLSTVGNHESDWYDSASYFSNGDSGGECGVMTTRLLPQPAPATTNQPWWSYDVGMIHFVGMSTEHNYATGTDQYRWLENDLKNVNRTVTPWIIFGGHRAMYLNSDYGGNVGSDKTVMDRLIRYIEPLLYKYRVNVGFYGHNHVVQRQSAVLKKQVVQSAKKVTDSEGNTIFLHEDPQATVHMVVGTGGADFTKNAESPGPEWNEMVFYKWGYARVTAVNSTYLDWQWIEAETGEMHDHMVITQSDPTQPWNAEAVLRA